MATQALRFLSGSNGFIPQATGQVIAFIRKESDFPINKYVQYIETPTTVAEYLVMSRDDFVRLTNDERYAWEDGDDRPQGLSEEISFQYVPFRTFRRNYPWRIGYQTLKQTAKYGSWDPKVAHMKKAIMQAMTNRTARVATLLQTSSNWPTSNTATSNQLNGGAGSMLTGSDDPNSPNFLAIFKTLSTAAQRIHLLTNGEVKPNKTRTVVSPNFALKLAQTSEIQNFCRSSPVSDQLLKDGWDPQYQQWGLPSTYKGFQFVVEDSIYVNTEPNTGTQTGTEGQVPEAALGTTGRQYIFQDTSVAMVSQPGGLDGEMGTQNYSTVQIYHYGGLLKVSAFESEEHERVTGHVQENIKEVLAAAFAGFLITNP